MREWLRIRVSSSEVPSALHKWAFLPVSPSDRNQGNFLRALYRSGRGDAMAEEEIKVQVCVLTNEASGSCSHGFL